jgi:hypothetical protein
MTLADELLHLVEACVEGGANQSSVVSGRLPRAPRRSSPPMRPTSPPPAQKARQLLEIADNAARSPSVAEVGRAGGCDPAVSRRRVRGALWRRAPSPQQGSHVVLLSALAPLGPANQRSRPKGGSAFSPVIETGPNPAGLNPAGGLMCTEGMSLLLRSGSGRIQAERRTRA